MSEPNLLELAKQGDARAIAALLNQSLQTVGITAKVALKDNRLNLMLEASKALNPEKTIAFIRKKITELQTETIKTVNVYGRRVGEDVPDWHQVFELVEKVESQEFELIQKAKSDNFTETSSPQIQNTYSAHVSTKQLALQSSNKTSTKQEEFYHIFVGYETASKGGIQKVTLRTGKTYDLNIKPEIVEGDTVRLKGCGIEGNDIVIVLHTLFSKLLNIDKIITDSVNKTKLQQSHSSKRCLSVYELVKNGEYTQDLAALDLLDFIIPSSEVDSKICQQYTLASQNSRLMGIEECVEETLNASKLSETEKELLQGTYQYIRAGEAIPDFGILNQLDSIIQNSWLPIDIKQRYSISSATSRAITVDIFIIELIQNSSGISEKEKPKYLSVYSQVRDGEEISDESTLEELDLLILNSDLIDDCKTIYKLARTKFLNSNGESAEEDITKSIDIIKDSIKKAAKIVPQATQIAKAVGIKAGTGAAISGLSGAAATNATLAFLGGGSVAAGGLGMLGGLAVATGGAALIGAAALVSIASVSQMDTEDKVHLGIAAVAGTLTSAAAVGTAWAAVGAFGVAGTGTAISTLSGAAAYSAIMAALGGVGVMTGGAALVAFGAGFAAWKFLKGNKDNPQRILQQLEVRLYTLLEKSNHPLIAVIEKYIAGKNNVFIAPDIPADRLSNSLSQYAKVDEQEKILVLVDTSMMGSAKDGMTFTDTRIMWKEMWGDPDFIKYSDITESNKELPKLYDENAENLLRLLAELGKLNLQKNT